MGCTKNMRQIKSYDDMFQVIRALTVKKIRKLRNLESEYFQNDSFFLFSLKCFGLDFTPRKDTTIHIPWHHSYISKHIISKKIVCLLLNSKR